MLMLNMTLYFKFIYNPKVGNYGSPNQYSPIYVFTCQTIKRNFQNISTLFATACNYMLFVAIFATLGLFMCFHKVPRFYLTIITNNKQLKNFIYLKRSLKNMLGGF